jgi:hypothetical protein
VSEVAERYAFSKYLLDPCRMGWSKSLRVMALVARFIKFCKEWHHRCGATAPERPSPSVFDQEELQLAANYFFRIGTLELK